MRFQKFIPLLLLISSKTSPAPWLPRSCGGWGCICPPRPPGSGVVLGQGERERGQASEWVHFHRGPYTVCERALQPVDRGVRLTSGTWVFPGRGAVHMQRTAVEHLLKVHLGPHRGQQRGEGVISRSTMRLQTNVRRKGGTLTGGFFETGLTDSDSFWTWGHQRWTGKMGDMKDTEGWC